MTGSRGFTLIELLVVVGILAGMMVAVSTMFLSVLGGARKAEAITLVKDNADNVMLTLERRIREGNGIVNCSSVSGAPFTVTFPSELGLGTLEVGNSLSIDGVSLLSTGVSVENVTASCSPGIEGFTPDKLSLTFTLTTGTGRSDYSQIYNTTITLRNVRPIPTPAP